MSNINQETGEALVGRSPRFTTWVAFLVFSTISLGSSVEVRNAMDKRTSDANWAVACGAITFALTTLMVLFQLHPVYSTMVTNNKLEGIVCIVLAAFWAATVSIVSDANNNLAVVHNLDEEGVCKNTVLNGNLYYFSWAGFVCSIVLLVSYLRSVFGVDVIGQVKSRSHRLELWAGMLACALVVMGASANVFQIDCKPMEDEGLTTYCRRTKFAISAGTIGAFISVVVVAMKLVTQTAPFVMEGILSFMLAILDGFGVAYITRYAGSTIIRF